MNALAVHHDIDGVAHIAVGKALCGNAVLRNLLAGSETADGWAIEAGES
jgi:hypothetical protein